MSIRLAAISLALTLSIAPPAMAQDPRSAAILAEQREKIDAFDWADGIWRGEASYQMGSQSGHLIQTERVSDYLGESVKLVEGRGYVEATGQSVFNALGIIKWHPELKAYRIHTFAQGNSGVYPIRLQADGYDWWIDTPVGKMLYETRVKDGVWREVGYRVAADGAKTQFFEMTLRRVADPDWPAPVPMDVGQK